MQGLKQLSVVVERFLTSVTPRMVLILLQVNHVSLGRSPGFHSALECDVLKPTILVSRYVDSGVRRELINHQ